MNAKKSGEGTTNFWAFKIRLSCVHVQTFMSSCSDFRAFIFRLSCVHVQTFVRSCPDFRSFTTLLCVHIQTFVRSCPDFRAFTRLLCVHVQTFVRFLMFPDYVNLNARRHSRAFIFRLGPQPRQFFLPIKTALITKYTIR